MVRVEGALVVCGPGPGLLFRKGRAAGLGCCVIVVRTLVANVPLAPRPQPLGVHDGPRRRCWGSSSDAGTALAGGWPVAAALAFNLLTPAHHVIENWQERVPIYSLRFELSASNTRPDIWPVSISCASRLGQRRQRAGSLAAIETVLEIAPENVAALISRGVLLNELGRVADAAACYDTAVRVAAKTPEVYTWRARFRLGHGQINAAQEDLRTAIELSPVGSPGRTAPLRELDQVAPEFRPSQLQARELITVFVLDCS